MSSQSAVSQPTSPAEIKKRKTSRRITLKVCLGFSLKTNRRHRGEETTTGDRNMSWTEDELRVLRLLKENPGQIKVRWEAGGITLIKSFNKLPPHPARPCRPRRRRYLIVYECSAERKHSNILIEGTKMCPGKLPRKVW